MTSAAQTYSESARGIRIDHERARVECERHGLFGDDVELCIKEVFRGRKYASATRLLQWLGY